MSLLPAISSDPDTEEDQTSYVYIFFFLPEQTAYHFLLGTSFLSSSLVHQSRSEADLLLCCVNSAVLLSSVSVLSAFPISIAEMVGEDIKHRAS